METVSIELGRTRIGIETGPAVVGDVGIRSKLDYTAHGDAVNVAARLEASNKELGSAICVGPGAAARCNAALLRPLGQLAVRGRAEPITVFEPWPNDAPSAWREAYLAAYAMLDRDTAHAGILLQKLIAERPLDLAVRRLAERLSSIKRCQFYPRQPTPCRPTDISAKGPHSLGHNPTRLYQACCASSTAPTAKARA